MKKILLLSFLVLASGITAFSQSWQWAQRGGTPTIGTAGFGPDEDINDIITDKNGNLYIITNIFNYQPNISGVTFNTYGQSTVNQICIASYKCDGTVRWVKLMSDCGGKARAIKLDTLGNVYVSGYITNNANSCRIRSNTTIDTTIPTWPNPIYRSMFVMKLDTVGTFNWITFPEPDTATYSGGGSYIFDMDVDEAGNIFLLAGLKPGAFAGGAFIVSHSVGVGSGSTGADKFMQLYMMKYNTNGVFQSGYHLPFTFKGTASFTASYKRDLKLHRNILSGICGYFAGDTLKINGQQVYTSYVAAFDDAGALLWMAQQDSMGQNGLIGTTLNRVTIDDDGNIYYPAWGMEGYSFNGSVVHNAYSGGVGYVVKMNSAGQNIWLRNMDCDGTSSCTQVALSGNTVAVWGAYGAFHTIWGTDTLTRPNNCGERAYIGFLDATTGVPTGVDSVQAPCGSKLYPAAGGNYSDNGTATIAADPFGNFYIGGFMYYDAILGNDTVVTIGGDQDWYIAKYGTANCSVPVAVQEINNTASVEVKVYPNPTTGECSISANADMAKVEVYNVVGTKVYTSSIKNNKTSIDLSFMAKGIYVYTVQLKQGGTVKGKIIVQ